MVTALWVDSKLKFEDWMDCDKVPKFITDYRLQFLMGDGSVPSSADGTGMSFKEIELKLCNLLSRNTPAGSIILWVIANVGDRANTAAFVRLLITAILNHAINEGSQLDQGTLRETYDLFTRFINANLELEVQALYAIHAVIDKLHYPQGRHIVNLTLLTYLTSLQFMFS